jgi:ATP-dependent Lon protease
MRITDSRAKIKRVDTRKSSVVVPTTKRPIIPIWQRLSQRLSECETSRQKNDERLRRVEEVLGEAVDKLREHEQAHDETKKQLRAANDRLERHDEKFKVTNKLFHQVNEMLAENRQAHEEALAENHRAHEETNKQFEFVETRMDDMSASDRKLCIDTEHLEARIEGLKSRPTGTQCLSEAQLALLARVPSKTDLENMGFWVTDSIEVLKKDLTGKDRKTKAALEKRLTSHEKSAQTAESKLRKVLMKADLWRFSRAVDEAIRDAMKNTLRIVGQAMDAKIDGKELDLVPSGDFYGMQMDEERDANVPVKRELVRT